ncbi:hypothetical protein N7931_11710 [Catenovulum sp. 2E275]|uniref:hypothetical protein n=1 Tax=Catenovulum sp. 2E275 TaxID=2980497 RepID=UPI0021D15379|nr:hypothetical protein [Catenovulum sp. 2E275]MCU4676292.1 hypothetical protein [Catenovulum sp. 2E275]
MNQKHKLLDKEAYQKQLKQKQQKAAIERQQALIKQKMADLSSRPKESQLIVQTKAPSKTKYYVMALFLVTLACLPYPKVIVYEKLGIVAQSIYIPSRFGSQPFILDSQYKINLDQHQRWLYLCDEQNSRHCTRYDIVEIKGLFSAIKLFFTGSL